MNSKQKGKRGELELAAFLRECGFSDARRGQQFKGSPDSPDVVGVPGHHVECKRVQTLRLHAALEQAQKDAGDGDTPIVAFKANHKPWVAILKLQDYLGMVKRLTLMEE